MRNISRWIALGLGIIGIVGACGPEEAQARPQYLKVFQDVYPARKTSTKCAICHAGQDKKVRNDYGQAVEEALGAKNVKDVEAIKAALKKAEEKLPRLER